MNYFFDEMPEEVAAVSVGQLRGALPALAFLPDRDPASKRETLELVGLLAERTVNLGKRTP